MFPHLVVSDLSGTAALLVEENVFKAFLEDNNSELIWSIHGGKEIYSESHDSPGIFRIRGAVLYDGGKFTKLLNMQFEDRNKPVITKGGWKPKLPIPKIVILDSQGRAVF